MNAKFINLIAEVVKLLNEVLVAKRKTASIQVAVVAPFDDPVGHTVDEIRRIGLDDDLIDATGMLVPAVGENVPEFAEGVDGGGQLGALTGRTDSVVELERLVVCVVGAPVDAASCDGVCTAVISTRTVGGDEDVPSVIVLVPQAVTGMGHLCCGWSECVGIRI